MDPSRQDFRLTLTSGSPVTTADVLAATTIYLSPYDGSAISLYNGSYWVVRTTAEISLALGTLTSTIPYDVFCYDNSGVPTLELLAWSSVTARATLLAQQDGVWVKGNDSTRRLVGTIFTASTTTTEDSAKKRYVWNVTNRVKKHMKCATETTDSWVYTNATIRQANGNAANQLDYVCGLAEDSIYARVKAIVNNGAVNVSVGIGIDSTTVSSAVGMGGGGNTIRLPAFAIYRGIPGVGRHTVAWLESSVAAGTTTWYGDNGEPTYSQSSIVGDLYC